MIPKKIVLLLLLIFCVGCDGFIGGDGGIEVYDPYHGSEGLVINFLENAPSEYIYSGENLQVGVLVKNDGAFDVEDSVLKLTYTTGDIEIVGGDKQSIKLEGKSTTRQFGAQDVVFWNAAAKEVKFDRSTKIGVIAQYKYQTNAIEDICIDPDKYGEKLGEKTCQTKDTISLSDQGAPVAVTKIETVIIPKSRTEGDIEFTISVENLRDGFVYDGPNTVKNGALNTLNIVATLSGNQITCTPSNIKLEEGETKCTASYKTNTEYETPLHIRLDYIYEQTVPPKEITLKRYIPP